MIVNGVWMKVGDDVECPKCGKVTRWRGSVLYKGVRYCNHCYKIESGWIGVGGGRGEIKLEDAEQKIRKVCSYVQRSNGNVKCYNISVPKCYAGKKVRVIVVEEGEDSS